MGSTPSPKNEPIFTQAINDDKKQIPNDHVENKLWLWYSFGAAFFFMIVNEAFAIVA